MIYKDWRDSCLTTPTIHAGLCFAGLDVVCDVSAMVVSNAEHLPETYQLWKQFDMTVAGRTQRAIAVPEEFARALSSFYTILVTTIVLNVWCILFAIPLYALLKRGQLHSFSTSLWNKRSSMVGSFSELLSNDRSQWRMWWTYPVIFIMLSCWATQIALSIIIPLSTFVDHAAPVNPNAVFVPPDEEEEGDNSTRANILTLDVNSALRAAGSARVASNETRSRVSLLHTTLADDYINGNNISETRVEYKYSYEVTGVDFGLQRHPGLALRVTGQCMTEYEWINASGNYTYYPDAVSYVNDTYAKFMDTSDLISVTGLDGPPRAFFYIGDKSTAVDYGENTTWAALVSSVDRRSFTEGHDPFYKTSNLSRTGFAGFSYSVLPQRPVLSCWETNQMSQDIEHLVLAAFIATANTLTETTLCDLSSFGNWREHNIVLGNNSQPAPGSGDFVVWSNKVTTLSMDALVAIPVVAVLLTIVVLILLNWTPLKSLHALDAPVLHKTITEHIPEAKPHREGVWKTDHNLNRRYVEDRDVDSLYETELELEPSISPRTLPRDGIRQKRVSMLSWKEQAVSASSMLWKRVRRPMSFRQGSESSAAITLVSTNSGYRGLGSQSRPSTRHASSFETLGLGIQEESILNPYEQLPIGATATTRE